MKYRIQAQWNQFRTRAMHPKSPPNQVQEMRRAFYAGAECALNRLSEEVSPGDAVNDPGDEKMMEEVMAELAQFARDVKEGLA